MDSDLGNTVLKTLPEALRKERPTHLDLSQRVRRDLFATLPDNVLPNIIEHLELNDTLVLREASWHVLNWSQCNVRMFGMQMIRLHLLPWFWEMEDFVASISDPDFDWLRCFLWLEAVTEPKMNMSGPFIGVANRYRIWDACQQLLYDYQERLQPDLVVL